MTQERDTVLTVEKIKTDLKLRCERIPEDAWSLLFPNLSPIPLTSQLSSELLKRHLVGHEEIETNLGKDGIIRESLVHYETDGPDSEKKKPDDVLGEISDKNYQDIYSIAISKLAYLESKAA